MEHIRKPWHLLHLMKREENVENVDCQCCRQSVSEIPTYKCLDCNFFVHVSCDEEAKKRMEVRHDLSHTHHVISTELDKYGEKEAICLLCEKRVPHSLDKKVSMFYNCVIQNCNFLTHESCIALPVMMVFDGFHDPRHALFLKSVERPQGKCSVCQGYINGDNFFYDCSKCFYKIHSKCVTQRKDKVGKCNPHKYIVSWNPIEFTCDLCGNKSSDFGLHCSECRLLIHPDCDRFMRVLTETGHEHSLTFTLSLSQDKLNVCQACGEKVNTNFGAYCCSEQECEHVFHLFCGYGIDQQGGTNDPNGCPPYLVGWIIDEKKRDDVDMKIHPSHPEHELLWTNEEPKNKVCQGCEESILVPPFYSCGKSDFCLHIRCALLPQKLNRPHFGSSALILQKEPADVIKSPFWCHECECLYRGFRYRLPIGYRPNDIHCALIPDSFTHSLHEHQLFRGRFGEQICRACGIPPRWVRQFECKTCNFRVCIKCLTLPFITKHKYDKHLLNLVNSLKDNTDENYCQICEEKIDLEFWFYYCKMCDFSGHSQCILSRKKSRDW